MNLSSLIAGKVTREDHEVRRCSAVSQSTVRDGGVAR